MIGVPTPMNDHAGLRGSDAKPDSAAELGGLCHPVASRQHVNCPVNAEA